MPGDGSEPAFGKAARTGKELQYLGGGNPLCRMVADIVKRRDDGLVVPVVSSRRAASDGGRLLELLNDGLANSCAHQPGKNRDGLSPSLFEAGVDAGECRSCVFANEFVVVDADDKKVVWNGESDFTRGGKDALRHCVSGGEDADRARERG